MQVQYKPVESQCKRLSLRSGRRRFDYESEHKRRRGENEVAKLMAFRFLASATPAAAYANSFPEGVNAGSLVQRDHAMPVELAVELEGCIAAAIS